MAATIAARSAVLGGAAEGAKRPTVIVGVTYAKPGMALDDASFFVVGGHLPGRGWADSAGSAGVIAAGGKIALHRPLSARPAGEITLTGAEEVGRAGDVHWGLLCGAKITEAPQASTCEYVGAWSSDTGHTPRWLDAESLSVANQAYRRVVGEWLSAREVAPSVIASVEITQIVRVDINDDGRDEVFLAFETPGIAQPDASGRWRRLCTVREVLPGSADCEPGPTPEVFSYLVMRHLPKGSRVVQTVVLADESLFGHDVIGFCDVNGDGWAEVVSNDHMIDYSHTKLNYWTGSRYIALPGVGGSA